MLLYVLLVIVLVIQPVFNHRFLFWLHSLIKYRFEKKKNSPRKIPQWFLTCARPAGRTVGLKADDFFCCSEPALTSMPPPSFMESWSSISMGVICPRGASMGSSSVPASPSPLAPIPSTASSADFSDTAILLGSDLVFILMMGVLLREMAATAAGSAPPSSGASHGCSWAVWSPLWSSGGFEEIRFTGGPWISLSSTEAWGPSVIPKNAHAHIFCVGKVQIRSYLCL